MGLASLCQGLIPVWRWSGADVPKTPAVLPPPDPIDRSLPFLDPRGADLGPRPCARGSPVLSRPLGPLGETQLLPCLSSHSETKPILSPSCLLHLAQRVPNWSTRLIFSLPFRTLSWVSCFGAARSYPVAGVFVIYIFLIWGKDTASIVERNLK